MNKEEIKHIDELYKASQIIEELGFEPNVRMCNDRPDLVLPSIADSKVGIEVVTYSTHRYEEAEDALYKILEEYIDERLDKRSEKRYEIGIYFNDLSMPTDINFQKEKEQIFDELDDLLFFHRPLKNHLYLADVTIAENPGVNRSFIGQDTVVVYDDLNEQVLLECIKHKERKLKEYKSLEKNQSIQEYYLVIFFPLKEHAEIRGYALPKTFETDYNRIYLVDYFYTNRIK